MHFIEALYFSAALFGIGACVPQLRQLVKSRASDELSVASWSIWLATQSVTLVYVASIGNLLMTAVNVVWVSFYATMVVLIVKYRQPAREPIAVAAEEA